MTFHLSIKLCGVFLHAVAFLLGAEYIFRGAGCMDSVGVTFGILGLFSIHYLFEMFRFGDAEE